MALPPYPNLTPVPTPLPQRGQVESVFTPAMNSFIAWTPNHQQNLLDSMAWIQQTYGATEDVYHSTVTAGQVATDAVLETEALRDTTLSYRNDALDASASATNSATDAAASRDAVINNQEQAGAILGAGIGTTYVDDGELFINYIEPVTDVSINASGNLSITYA